MTLFRKEFSDGLAASREETKRDSAEIRKDIAVIQADLKRDIAELKKVLGLLINQRPLEARYCDHSLSGKLRDRRECHIEPDWLLMHKPTKTMIIFERKGSHTDLYE